MVRPRTALTNPSCVNNLYNRVLVFHSEAQNRKYYFSFQDVVNGNDPRNWVNSSPRLTIVSFGGRLLLGD